MARPIPVPAPAPAPVPVPAPAPAPVATAPAPVSAPTPVAEPAPTTAPIVLPAGVTFVLGWVNHVVERTEPDGTKHPIGVQSLGLIPVAPPQN